MEWSSNSDPLTNDPGDATSDSIDYFLGNISCIGDVSTANSCRADIHPDVDVWQFIFLLLSQDSFLFSPSLYSPMRTQAEMGKTCPFLVTLFIEKVKAQFSLQRSCRMRRVDSFLLVLSACAVLCRGLPAYPQHSYSRSCNLLNTQFLCMFPDWCMAPGNKYEWTNNVCPPECTVIEAVRYSHVIVLSWNKCRKNKAKSQPRHTWGNSRIPQGNLGNASWRRWWSAWFFRMSGGSPMECKGGDKGGTFVKTELWGGNGEQWVYPEHQC